VIRASGGQAMAVRADVANADVVAMFDKIDAKLAAWTALVNGRGDAFCPSRRLPTTGCSACVRGQCVFFIRCARRARKRTKTLTTSCHGGDEPG
jgi:NAD(P)-dependent dehydrogenase (short-subunit alcohol dehydrogenase family)